MNAAAIRKNPNFIAEDTREESKEQWLKKRVNSIGGSEASSILALNPYKPAYELFCEKIGEVEPPQIQNSRMFFGTILEDKLREVYRYWDGSIETTMQNYEKGIKINEVIKPNFTAYSKKYPWMSANFDGIVERKSREGLGILEIKTMGGWMHDQYEGGLPPYHYIQLQHYLAVTGYTWGDLVVLVDSANFIVYTFERDEETIAKIIDAEAKFWDKVDKARKIKAERGYLLEEDYIEFDGSNATTEFLKNRYNNPDNEIMVDATEAHLELVTKGINLRKAREDYELQENEVWNQIKAIIGNKGGLDCGASGKITWKSSQRQGKIVRTFKIGIKS